MTIPDKSEVLTAINDLRAELGLEPLDAIPLGIRCSGYLCPVANALRRHSYVGQKWATARDKDGVIQVLRLTTTLQRFLIAFDLGEYPELVNHDRA